jgi:tRNA (guanine-N7-)-methyltransferase
MSEPDHPRAIRSFVVRGGRITPAQQRALQELWPRFGVEFEPRALDLDALFGRRAGRIVEIGFGNGENLTALARANPDRDYLGIEVHPPGVGRLLMSLESLGLKNVRISNHDAVEVFAHQIPHGSIDEIYILFPDPWPKKRHHKRRLIQAPFAASMAQRLKPGGLLQIATDWGPYADYLLEVLDACRALENLSASNGFVPRDPRRNATRFEKRGERLGHEVWELAYRRR